MIKFFKGASDKYDAAEHGNGIFFTTDTDEILVNSDSYGKNADKSLTTDDIIVAGGPLADDITTNWPDEWNRDGNKIIPKGTSVQSLFEGLFLKPVNGTVSWGNVSWNPTLSNPTVVLQKNDANKTDAGSSLEVGTTLVAKTTTSNLVNNNVRSAVCTASEGHFTETDGSWNSGNYTESINGNAATGTLAVTYEWNDVALDSFVSQSTTFKIASGSNKFKVSQSGITVTTNNLPQTTIYASTNTKKVLSGVSATLNDSANETSRTKNLTSQAEDTITGYYRYFIGECDSINADLSNLTSDVIRGLISSGKSGAMTTNQISYTADHNSGKGFIVACPASYTIDYIKDDAAVFEGGFTLKTMNVKDAGDSDVNYNVYYCNNTGSNKAIYKFFKFK